jgi:hypothetical protein
MYSGLTSASLKIKYPLEVILLRVEPPVELANIEVHQPHLCIASTWLKSILFGGEPPVELAKVLQPHLCIASTWLRSHC